MADLENTAKLLRYYSLTMTTRAGSGHPTSSLSFADFLAVLIAGDFLHYDIQNPKKEDNDRIIFSKGHASPLYYALYRVIGALNDKDLEGYRKITSKLEGHPTPRFIHTMAATGSLGQGLSVSSGIALSLKRKFTLQGKTYNKNGRKRLPLVYCLVGDGEMAEGSFWEGVEIASHYKLDNLVLLADINRLGQSQETMLGHDIKAYKRRFEAFGWEAVVLDGHNFKDIESALEKISTIQDKPVVLLARTEKGRGISLMEGKDGWHGKPLTEEELKTALKELGKINFSQKIKLPLPVLPDIKYSNDKVKEPNTDGLKFDGKPVATRKAYGMALAMIGQKDTKILSLDADTKNSTYSIDFKDKFPDRFYEMYIAEQNMMSMAVGLSRMGYKPFVSTFAAFLTRTYDQVRMAAISGADIKICGSHAGVSIGEDGPSQMGLEDIAMFRAIHGSTVLYPSDAMSTYRLVELMADLKGIVYLRTTRPATELIYKSNEKFPIGGFKVHKIKGVEIFGKGRLKGKILIISAGIILFEALKSQKDLAKKGIETCVVDLYSVKPIDKNALSVLAEEYGRILTVEDHWIDGGLGDAVLAALGDLAEVRVWKLGVNKMPRSGKTAELIAYAGLDASSITSKSEDILKIK